MKLTKLLDKHFVSDWRDSWRYYGTHANFAIAAVVSAVAASPDLLLQLVMFLPEGHWARLALVALVIVVMFVLPTIARLWNQHISDDGGDEAKPGDGL